MEGAQTQQAHYLRGSGARGVQNHRRTRLGVLQLFEQAGRGSVIDEWQAYQHDIEIPDAEKLEAFRLNHWR